MRLWNLMLCQLHALNGNWEICKMLLNMNLRGSDLMQGFDAFSDLIRLWWLAHCTIRTFCHHNTTVAKFVQQPVSTTCVILKARNRQTRLIAKPDFNRIHLAICNLQTNCTSHTLNRVSMKARRMMMSSRRVGFVDGTTIPIDHDQHNTKLKVYAGRPVI